MQLWHLTPDARRTPHRVSPGEWVTLDIGSSPVEPGQSVWVTCRSAEADETRVEAVWRYNQGENSYWRAELQPFFAGTVVRYQVYGRSPAGEVTGPAGEFRVGPKLHLALLWHQHQPLYKDLGHAGPRGSYTQPWVRLHAIRDYYSMAALIAEHPALHLTINLTPVLLWQILDYVEQGATDRHLELTRRPAEALSPADREEMSATFFDAQWETQIAPYERYRELFAQRQRGDPATPRDLRDLQMWSNLVWFGKEFRDGDIRLATGEVASVRGFIERARGFTEADIEAMVAEQLKIMGAIVPIHRGLQDAGQLEVATTPFYHPILPLLVDTDAATIDRPGSTVPRRFAHPEDAEAQVRLAVEHYIHCFGRPPRGMWPAEGAVSQSVVPLFAQQGVGWIATDAGVLARSGRWGYRAEDPDVLCQPYRVEEGSQALSVFFRDAWLADHIGFHYHASADYPTAAGEFLAQLKERFARRVTGDDDRVLTVVLDGENAWSAYREDARPFLHALYGLLERDAEILTVTFAEYLDGNPARGVRPHRLESQAKVHDLFTGSWIDEIGSAPGVDLGTWIGEAEENRAWELLGAVRDDLDRRRASPAALEALYAAEGSDWFWWFGDDQDSGKDPAFDDLFRTHLRSVYRALGVTPPPWLDARLVPRRVLWTVTQPVAAIQPGDRLSIRTTCPGTIAWWTATRPETTHALGAVGGVMGGAHHYEVTLGPVGAADAEVRFRLYCTSPGRETYDQYCSEEERSILIAVPAGAQADEGRMNRRTKEKKGRR
jgi:alpha-amylase/alpha-mannosidase (GH57 family)